MKRSITTRLAALLLSASLAGAMTFSAGCNAQKLSGAPNIYTHPTVAGAAPYAAVPEALQTTDATVIYGTDRVAETVDGSFSYGIGRSPQLAFGTCVVRMGDSTTRWADLVDASTSSKRDGTIALTMGSVDELGKFPSISVPVQVDGEWVDPAPWVQGCKAATEALHALLRERLALTPQKELFIFVHGYNNTFAEGAFRAAQIWHFVGRGGVPVLYSWPAGSAGLLKGYTRDRESSEYTVAHFKQFLLAAASCPEVRRINIIAHSRGTDVVSNALREIHLECRGAGTNTREKLKLGNVVLAAPDIDLEVFVQRFQTDRVGMVPEHLTIYVSPNDEAIGLSSWLFGSARRLGLARMDDLTPESAAAVKTHPTLCIVDVRAHTLGMGHDYFLSSPAALSDLILVLRDQAPPGAEYGRPLVDQPKGFWELRDGYPPAPKAPVSN